jgi:hypothetical protein
MWKGTKRGDVIKDILEALGRGRGVVPLIGSGMSAASGIPSGSDYRAYLFHCLRRVFDDTRDGRWDPSTLLWPPFSEIPKIGDLSAEMIRWSEHVQKMLLREVERRRSREAFEAERAIGEDRQARWQASGVAADWRATLHLLSRVGPRPNGGVRIKDADPLVIDSFFVNLTEGKRPNAAHSLLAHLADVLRIEVMLTTNFDNLIETAFQRLDMPLVTFDVHYDAGLPSDRLVRARRSLVKLHGGRYGLRADFSLDTHPQQSDIDKFCNYLAPYADDTQPEVPSKNRETFASRDLLVMGVSGEERRTVGLVCHALTRFSNLKVHWICYSESDVTLADEAFRQELQEIGQRPRRASDPAAKDDRLERIRITLSPDLTLFLLELYQHIFLCLPPSRVGFPAIWPSPPSPLRELVEPKAANQRGAKFSKEANELAARISEIGVASKKDPRLVLVHGPPGASSIASEAYSQLNGVSHRIWIDLKQRFDETDFAFSVLESLARDSGVSPPFPLERETLRAKTGDAELRQRLLSQLTRRASRPFAIFINARDLPTKGWSEPSWYTAFVDVIQWLGNDQNVRVIVVSWDSFYRALRKTLTSKGKTTSPFFHNHRTAELAIGSSRAIAKEVLRVLRAENDRRFWRFVLGLTLIRYPCHLSALHSWALLPSLSEAERQSLRYSEKTPHQDNDDERSAKAEEFLEHLREARVIRDDAGNNVFMYLDYRTDIGDLIRKSRWGRSFEGQVARAEAHQGIADWYIKLYRSSGEVHAAFESIYQRLQCIREAQQLRHQAASTALIQSSVTEIGVALDLLVPDVDSSARPLTLVRLWSELLDEMSSLLGDGFAYPSLKTHKAKLAQMQASYLEAIGEAQPNGSDADSAPSTPNTLVPPSSGIPPSHPTDPAVSEHLLREPHFLLWTRQYDKAADSIEDIIGKLLDLETGRVEPTHIRRKVQAFFAPGQSGQDLRNTAQAWACKREAAWCKHAVKTLRRYHLLELYRAEVARLVADQLHALRRDSEPMRATERQLLERAERIYLLSAELMRYMDDTSTLQGENALLRAQAGILLSWMGRPREAQRRYVEAYGYLSYISGPTRPARWATVDLRRTETFLCQLEKLGPKRGGNTAKQQRLGHIYDAVSGVERAAYKIQDSAVNIRWYGWLREIDLSVCLEIARLDEIEHRRFSRCRDREGLDEWFIESFEGGLYRVLTDPLRLARYYDLAHQFLEARKGACKTQPRIMRCCAKARDTLERMRKLTNPSRASLRGEDNVAQYGRLVLAHWHWKEA